MCKQTTFWSLHVHRSKLYVDQDETVAPVFPPTTKETVAEQEVDREQELRGVPCRMELHSVIETDPLRAAPLSQWMASTEP
ncbi:hypothetical protein VTO73DRAFT_15460 [Trametes versicolor]